MARDRSWNDAMMQHKGYMGKVEFDDEAGIFHGEVMNTRDVITFQGKSVAELKKAFQDSVDDYLAFCAERGEEPDKPFSGQFVARIPPELHRKVNLAASVSGKSLNTWVSEQLESAVAGLSFPATAVAAASLRIKEDQHPGGVGGRDHTKYDVVAGKPYQRLSKRRAVFVIVRHLCDVGVTPEAIKAAVPLHDRERLFRVVDGRPFAKERYFCERAELIHCGKTTYAVTNQWSGRDFIPTINGLLNAFSDRRIACTQSLD